ncbi:MAG: ankyrin repeat domain-containing protein [Limisphaerales bacterium]
MKTKALLLLVALLAVFVGTARAADTVAVTLQKGLFEEEANHNLDAAIQAYQSVITRFDDERKLAATAVFRLGECYRKLGQTNEANAQYQRVVREFPDQAQLVKLSREYLGLEAPPTAAGYTYRVQKGDTLSSILEAYRNRGIKVSTEDALRANPNLDPKRLRVGETILIPTAPGLPTVTTESGAPPPMIIDGQEYQPATQQEADELQRIIAMTKDSPDLVNAMNSANNRGPGFTPLYDAAGQDRIAVAKYLLAHGANVNSQDDIGFNRSGVTPLYAAVRKGHKSMAELLLAHGANINAKDSQGETPLHAAAGHGYAAVTEVLLAHGADVNAKDNTGRTPLFIAVGYQAMVELLLAHGAEINAKALKGWTPLHAAITGNNLPVARLLLTKGADVNAAAAGPVPPTGETHVFNGFTPLHLVESGWYPTSIDMARLLLEYKANVSAKDANGRTPLCLAVERGWVEMAKLLLDHKADPNVRYTGPVPLSPGGYAGDLSPITPLRAATVRRDGAMEKLLLTYGADPNAKNGDGRSPFLAAVLDGFPSAPSSGNISFQMGPQRGDSSETDPELMDLFVKRADINATDRQGRTALHYAVLSGKTNLIQVLLAHHTNVNAKDDNGRTPLWEAVQARRINVAESLLHHGADVNTKDSEGRVPLFLAVARANVATVKLLLDHGAEVNQAVKPPGWAPRSLVHFAQGIASGMQPQLDGSAMTEDMRPAAAEIVGLLRQHGAWEKQVVVFWGAVNHTLLKLEPGKVTTLSEGLITVGLTAGADLRRVGLSHISSAQSVDVESIKHGGAKDIPLEDGDSVVVPAKVVGN